MSYITNNLEKNVRDKQHYLNMFKNNPNASIGFQLATSAVYAARFGQCDGDAKGTHYWRAIADDLKSKYGESIEVEKVVLEMDKSELSKIDE